MKKTSFFNWVRVVGIFGGIVAINTPTLGLASAMLIWVVLAIVLAGASIVMQQDPVRWPVLFNMYAGNFLVMGHLSLTLIGLMMIAWSLHRYERPDEAPPA